MAKKVILKDLNDIEVLPITRGELVLDASGNPALHSTLFLATDSLPGLMSSEDKYKLDHLEESGPGANNKVAQINTTTDDVYRLLFSETADDTDRTEGSRKSANLTFNPSTGVLNLTGTINANGGTITSNHIAHGLTIHNSASADYAAIRYQNDGTTVGYIGVGGEGCSHPNEPVFITTGAKVYPLVQDKNDVFIHRGSTSNTDDLNTITKTGSYQTLATLNLPSHYAVWYGNAINFVFSNNLRWLFWTTDTYNTYKLFFRKKDATAWSDWKQIAFTSDIPTKISELENDSGYVTGGPYLPLSGGTITSASWLPLTINSTDSGGGVAIKISTNGVRRGGLTYNTYGLQLYNENAGKFIGVTDDGTPTYSGNVLIHSGNIGSLSVGNASTADKLKNKVKIWGLDFDGSSNVVGSILSNTSKSNYIVNGGIYHTAAHFYMSDIASGEHIDFAIGKKYAEKQMAYFGYAQGSDNNSTYLRIGFHSVDNIITATTLGNVGIGTTDPKYKLDVNGAMHLTDSVFANYSIFANSGKNGCYLHGTGISWHDSTNSWVKDLFTYGEDNDRLTAHRALNCANTLDVAGSTTLKSLSATSGSFSSTLSVTSTSTFTGKTTHDSGASIRGVTLIGQESNDIYNVYNDNGCIKTNSTGLGSAIRNALNFQWYDTSWQIGNIRSSNTASDGFGVTYGNNNLCFRVTISDCFVGSNKIIHSGNYKDYVDDMYWANVPVSSTSNDKTTPTFGLTKIKGGADIGLDIYTSSGYGRIRFYNASNANNATIHYFENDYGGYSFVKDSLNLGCSGLVTLGGWNNPTLVVSGNTTTSNSDGKVGIGTTAPNAKLQVNGHTLINKRLTIGLDLGNWDPTRAEIELISPSGYATDFWMGSGQRDWSISTRTPSENSVLCLYAYTTSATAVVTIEKSGNTIIRGNLNIGASDTRNYIAFRGTTGDNPGSFNHTYIGENLWASSESSELVLFKGNDVATTATTAASSGPDRIRHIAAGHLFQIYKSALSGTFETICTSTVPVNILAINQNSIQTFAPLLISGERYLSSGTGDYGINLNNSDIIGINAMYTQDLADSGTEGLQFSRGNGYYDSIWANSGTLYFSPNGNLNGCGSYGTNYAVLHSGNYSSYALPFYTKTSGDCNSMSLGLTALTAVASNQNGGNHSAFLTITSIGTPFQLQIPDSSEAYIYKRYKSGSSWSGWSKLSAGYADSAGTATTASRLSLTPTQTALNNCVPSANYMQCYRTNTSDTGGGDGWIQAYAWDGNYATLLYFDVDPTYNLSVRHRDSAGSWTSWKKLAYTSDLPPVKAYKWNATILGSTWSRLYTGNNSTLHHSSIFSVTGSIGCVVFSHTFLVEANHSTSASIIQLFGGNYTQFSIRTLVNSAGDVLIDMNWSGNDCSVASSTLKMTVEINAICLSGSISPTTSFVSDASIPSGYTSSCSYSTRSNCSVFMELYSHGNVYGSHFYETSDAKHKTNIQSILDYNNIPLLRLFDWKESGLKGYGLIALELELLGYYELVDTDDQGEKTVNYSAALSLIVGKLQVKIKELEKEIEILKNK